MRLLLVQVSISLMRKLTLSNKVIEIQAGDEKKELTAETPSSTLEKVSNVLPIPGLATSKTSLTQQVSKTLDKLPETLESFWWRKYRS